VLNRAARLQSYVAGAGSPFRHGRNMGNKSTPPGDQADERIIVELIAGPLDGSHVAAKSKARRLRIAHPGGKAIYVREEIETDGKHTALWEAPNPPLL
jgi:hypothetical protein